MDHPAGEGAAVTPGDRAARVLTDAIAARVFPSATAEVGSSTDVLWREAEGSRTFKDPRPIDLTVPYDLASLTKVIATTTMLMQLIADQRVDLDDPIAGWFEEWRGRDREQVTIRDLLEHASGLPARLLDQPPLTRREFEHDICTMPLEYLPRSRSLYSDLGFLLLGFLVSDVEQAPLAQQFAAVWPDPSLTFELTGDRKRHAAPTLPMDEDPRRGRTLVGEVHDNYAAALGGAAGHAGLFGSAAAVGAFARIVLRAARGEAERMPFAPGLVARFTTKSTVAGSSRALGWDTMLTTSSCGGRMSPAAFGHVGFTGTSLWIDPARDRYFVLLTNRACGGGTVEQMRDVRRAFHDALAEL
jgi:CubicO group peptidase (beta-lactamase class C family)